MISVVLDTSASQSVYHVIVIKQEVLVFHVTRMENASVNLTTVVFIVICALRVSTISLCVKVNTSTLYFDVVRCENLMIT